MLLEKYAAGHLSRQEKADFFAAVADPGNQQLLEELLADIWKEGDAAEQSSPSEQSLRRISRVLERTRPAVKRRMYWPWAAAAAVLLAATFIALRYYRSAVPVPQQHLLSTRNGEKKKLDLPDGSVVTLNAGSSLQYNDAFNTTDREVSLQGEAFFDIAANTKQPFIVKSSHDIRTEVLGTSFNIRDYADEPEIKISVTTGKIRVLQRDQSLNILEKSDRLVFDKQNGRQQLLTYDTDREWNTGFLVFEGAPLKEVLTTLARTYGKDITLAADVPADLHVRATFHENQGLNNILDLICQLHNLRYTTAKEQQIIIRQNK